jgi:hypothetical protein
MLPEEQEQIYMQLLTSKDSALDVSESMRELVLEEWPELAHKLAPKQPRG